MKQHYRLSFVIIILYTVGFFLHLSCTTRHIAEKLTTPFLLTVNGLIIYVLFKNSTNKCRLGIFLAFALIFTLILEIVGSKTGLIFGYYTYGNTMWLKVLGVPLVIGLNWIVLLLAAYNATNLIFKRFGLNQKGVNIILASVLLTLLDYLIEPVAIKLDYWNWDFGTIPVQNYIAWFAISFVILLIAELFKVNISNKLLSKYYVLIFGYFILMQIFLRSC